MDIGLMIFGGALLVAFLGIWGGVKLFRKKADLRRSFHFTFLQILIPKKESKEDYERDRDQSSEIRKVVGIMEHLYSSLHGVSSGGIRSWFFGQDFLSLEYVAMDEEIQFFIGCPVELKPIIEKQITSFYSDAVIEETQAPQVFHEKTYQATNELKLTKEFFYPIKTYLQFDSADPVNTILNSLSNASDEKGSTAAMQIMIRPYKNKWQKKARQFSKKLSEGSSGGINPLGFLEVLWKGHDESKKEEKKESQASQETIKAIEEKSEKVAFETILRIVTSAPDKRTKDTNMASIMNSFSQFNAPSLNSFEPRKWYSTRVFIRNFLFRSFRSFWWTSSPMILSTEELASLFHFPHIRYNNVPGLRWQNYKIVKAPSNIPKDGLLLGHNVYRGERIPVYMKRDDRFRHFYVIGQTGTGKSSIFQSMARQDLRSGEGLCVIDPHGSLVESILPFIPRSRIDDVVIFDPSDIERPMGLNLLEAKTDEEREMVAMDAMNIMLKIFDEEVFGPRIQDYFRNGVLTLMADPAGGTLVDVVKLFTDDAFQRAKVAHVKNPVVKSFWTNQMAKTGAREKAEIIPYFAAKFGAFITNAMLRNIIGQTKSAFDFSQVMEEGKILLMNLSKGNTGEINSKLLGLIIVSKLQTAALRRQKQLSAGGKPRDFFMYIDEFQNYVTDSIESILSEARKYRLSLNIAHQYISQIDTSGDRKGVNLKDAIFGNVGTIMSYKIGAQDAEYMAKEMAPAFSDQDLINIDKYKAIMKLSIDTQPSKPFSIIPLNPYLEKGNDEMSQALKQISRLTYGRSKKFVEKEIFTRLDI